MLFIHMDIFADFRNQLFIDLSGEFHADRIHTLSLFYQILHSISVVHVFIINGFCINIRISRNSQERFFFDFIFFK